MNLEACQLRAEAEWLAGWGAGPTRTRWESTPIQVGDPAPKTSLITTQGEAVSLDAMWRDGPAILLFWRQFGCGCGLDRLDRLVSELPNYREQGANVIMIGQGEPEQAAVYAETYSVPVPILSDPQRVAYRAYGVLEGGPELVFYDASQELMRRDLDAGKQFAATRSAAGRAPVNSPWQLPAEFIVDGTGIVRLAYRYQYCDGFPDSRILIAVLRSLP